MGLQAKETVNDERTKSKKRTRVKDMVLFVRHLCLCVRGSAGYRLRRQCSVCRSDIGAAQLLFISTSPLYEQYDESKTITQQTPEQIMTGSWRLLSLLIPVPFWDISNSILCFLFLGVTEVWFRRAL